MGTGELRHDQTTSAQVADKAAENRIRDAGHRRQHSGRRNRDPSDPKFGWKWLHSLLLVDFNEQTAETKASPAPSQRFEESKAMKPWQVGVLVVVGGIAGCLVVKWTERSQPPAPAVAAAP